MFKKIGNCSGWGKFEICSSNGQNELQVFSSPVAVKSLSAKKQPTFCNGTNSFPMK